MRRTPGVDHCDVFVWGVIEPTPRRELANRTRHVKTANAMGCLAARNFFDEPTIRFASGVSRERVTVFEYTSSNGEFVTGLFVGQTRVSAGHVNWDTTIAGITAAAKIAQIDTIFDRSKMAAANREGPPLGRTPAPHWRVRNPEHRSGMDGKPLK